MSSLQYVACLTYIGSLRSRTDVKEAALVRHSNFDNGYVRISNPANRDSRNTFSKFDIKSRGLGRGRGFQKQLCNS